MPATDPLCPVEEVVITGALDCRASRPPDYAVENRALAALTEAMGDDPETVLQRLVESAMELTHSDSAGISILEPGGEQGIFRWVATAGQWAPYRNGTMPREQSPCGQVITRDTVLLVTQPERAFPALLQSDPLIREGLLAPFHVDGKPVGTVWVIKHSVEKRFEKEDARLLASLAQFASVAHRTVRALEDARTGEKESRRVLETGLADRERVNRLLRESEHRLAVELSGSKLLQRLSTRLIPEQSPEALFDQILDTALELMKADAVSIQLLDNDGKRLRRVATRNLHPDSTEYWTWVDASHASTCGQALSKNERVVLDDVEASPELVGTGDLEAFRASRTRAVQSSPLLTRTGQPIGMISTHWRTPRRLDEVDFGLFDILARQVADLFERSKAEATLRESEERQAFLLTLSDVLAPLSDASEIVTAASKLTGQHLSLDRCGYGDVDPALDHFMLTGWDRAAGACAFPSQLSFATSGTEFVESLRAGKTLVVDDVATEPKIGNADKQNYAKAEIAAFVNVPLVKGGDLIGMLSAHQAQQRHWNRAEVTLLEEVLSRTATAIERTQAQEALRTSENYANILLAELQHRVRNTLAVVRSIARRTAETTSTVDDMVAHFQGRLDAFSRVQAAITRSADQVVSLRSLVEDEMTAHAARNGEKVHFSGDGVALNARTAERLSLAIHELTTNAVKHGALSSPNGHVEISWRVEAVPCEPRLVFQWKEHGVRIPKAPKREGFGMDLLRRSLPYDLHAEVHLDFTPNGVVFDLSLPFGAPPSSACEVMGDERNL